jgi:hypothetical protein
LPMTNHTTDSEFDVSSEDEKATVSIPTKSNNSKVSRAPVVTNQWDSDEGDPVPAKSKSTIVVQSKPQQSNNNPLQKFQMPQQQPKKTAPPPSKSLQKSIADDFDSD